MTTDDAILLFASGFGLGWMPWAPGTFGSLLGLPLAWWLLGLARREQFAIAGFLVIVAIPICHVAANMLGGRDPGQIVADELMMLPLALLGLSALRSLWGFLLAFSLFRLFDTIKPPPVSWVENFDGGLGIVLDDAVAALLSWVVLVMLLALWRRYRRSRNHTSMTRSRINRGGSNSSG